MNKYNLSYIIMILFSTSQCMHGLWTSSEMSRPLRDDLSYNQSSQALQTEISSPPQVSMTTASASAVDDFNKNARLLAGLSNDNHIISPSISHIYKNLYEKALDIIKNPTNVALETVNMAIITCYAFDC